MADDKKKCFIIMPITTPKSLVEKYRDGEEHFHHVLKCLFIPAITKAGYIPIPPNAKGADLIHAAIIENIETTDLVLCDMSSLNANVFFELGTRTSLNKPVSLVKDDVTKEIPFDTGIINFHEYQSSLEPWELEAEIAKLENHLMSSAEGSKGENTLWKHFAFKSEAKPYQSESSTESKLDYLAFQVAALNEKMDMRTRDVKAQQNVVGLRRRNQIIEFLKYHMPPNSSWEIFTEDDDAVVLACNRFDRRHLKRVVERFSDTFEKRLLFIFKSETDEELGSQQLIGR